MDATPTTVVASSEFRISPDAFFPVRLWIYGINYRNTVTLAPPRVTRVMVRPQNTMGEVLGFLRENLPGCTRDLHVVLDGQTLSREVTFDQLLLPHDVNLQVTPHPKSWDILFQIITAIVHTSEVAAKCSELLKRYHESNELGLAPYNRHKVVARYYAHSTGDVVPLIRNFFNDASTIYPTQAPNHPEMIAEYLGVLSRGFLSFMVHHYLSNSGSRHIKANTALRYLLCPHSVLSKIPSQIVEVWTAPICVEVCRRIASSPGQGKNDKLYKFSRFRLAAVCHCLRKQSPPHNLPSLPRDWLIKQLTPFVKEKANEAIDCIMEGRKLSDVDLFEFNNLFDVLCWAVSPLRVGSLLGVHAGKLPQIAVLSETSMFLLNAISAFMARLAGDLPPMGPWSKRQLPNWVAEGLVHNIWDVLTRLYTWSKMDIKVASAMWASFTMHRASLNVLVLNTSIDMCLHGAGSIRWIVSKHRVFLGFEARRHIAMAMLPEMEEFLGVTLSPYVPVPEPLEMLIDRLRLLPNSFSYIMEATRHQLQSGLDIVFLNEQANGRGVRKEWLTLVSQALFNPQQGLFSPCPRDGRRFFLNPAPAADPLHLQYLNVAGRIIALALAHKVQVGICFDRTLFLQLAGQPVTMHDIADADPNMLASCKKILDMDPDAVESLCLTFSREVQVLRCRKIIDLLPGGRDIAVNGTNRSQYVGMLIHDLFVTSTHDALASFAEGFAMMPLKFGRHQEFFQGLDLDDFNRMLGGTMDALDVEEWRSRTILKGYREEDDQIKWFWTTVEGMTEEQRRRLLSFWTSRECLPFGGFHGLFLHPVITRAAHATSDHLPSSNTCTNNLNLPRYTSLSMTQSRLTFIVQEHIFTGFGIV